MKPSLIVIRAKNVDENVRFYSNLGLSFVEEQHGKGPVHYAAIIDSLVFEIYPCRESEEESNIRLGFNLSSGDKSYFKTQVWVQENATSSYINDSGFHVYIVSDPGGRKVEIGFERVNITN